MSNCYVLTCTNNKCDNYEPETTFNCFWGNIIYDDLDDLDMASDFVRGCVKAKKFVCDKVEYEEK